jgi:hypothetical protein
VENEKSMVEEMVSEMPGVSEHADEIIKEEEKNATPEPESNAVGSTPQLPPTVSPVVEGFNPEIHKVDSLGNPIKNMDGSFKRKPGRKKGQSNANVSAAVNDPGSNGVTSNPVAAVNQAAIDAEQTVWALFVIGQSVFGDEWQPEPAEPEMLKQAWEKYYAVAPLNVPYWFAPVLATGMYAGKRFHKPKTASKLKRFWNWSVDVWGYLTGRLI